MALPPPINGTEAYLAAVYDRLGEVLARLPEPQPSPQAPAEKPETVELREPAPQPGEPVTSDAPAEQARKEPISPRTARKRTTTRKGGS